MKSSNIYFIYIFWYPMASYEMNLHVIFIYLLKFNIVRIIQIYLFNMFVVLVICTPCMSWTPHISNRNNSLRLPLTLSMLHFFVLFEIFNFLECFIFVLVLPRFIFVKQVHPKFTPKTHWVHVFVSFPVFNNINTKTNHSNIVLGPQSGSYCDGHQDTSLYLCKFFQCLYTYVVWQFHTEFSDDWPNFVKTRQVNTEWSK